LTSAAMFLVEILCILSELSAGSYFFQRPPTSVQGVIHIKFQ